MKTPDGNWNMPKAEWMLNAWAVSIVGYRSHRLLQYRSYPAADVRLSQEQSQPYIVFREIEMRIMMYEDYYIKLECGDVLQTPVTGHERTVEHVCRPFFDSLSFK
jgi:hypothetical protein